MLSKLIMKLESDDRITINMASLFHGALMELIPEDLGTILHQSNLHPFSSHLERKGEDWYWVVSCLNGEISKRIMKETLMGLESVYLRHHEQAIRITEKEYVELPYEQLSNIFYNLSGEKYITIRFVTPAAFKQRGRYLFYPDLRCIFQSLMNKYDSAVLDSRMVDEDTLDQLCNDSEIVRYNLKSTQFALEGIRVPSFVGQVTIRFYGTQTMASFAKMLFTFGEFSGIGIKCSLGMGAIEIITRKEKES